MSRSIGVDEVGRGALAGPLIACAARIVNERRFPFKRVKDSKLLTDSERRALMPLLQTSCAWSYGIVSNNVIDRSGIQAANVLAFDLALLAFPRSSRVRADHVGGFEQYTSPPRNIEFHTHGESKFPEIAAASILAKVYRDDMMIAFGARYPQYGFAQHKGYGTEAHRAAIQQYGPLFLHRITFISL